MDWSHGGVPWRGPMEGSQWSVAHLDDRALDEAAAGEEGELELLDPPAADRGSCPLSDHPRGITSEAVQLARGSNPSRTVCHGHRGAPPADATRGARDAADDARRRRERARLREGWLGRVPSQRGGIRIDRGRPAGNSEPSAERQGRVKEKPRGRDRERRMGDGGSIATEQADS